MMSRSFIKESRQNLAENMKNVDFGKKCRAGFENSKFYGINLTGRLSLHVNRGSLHTVAETPFRIGTVSRWQTGRGFRLV